MLNEQSDAGLVLAARAGDRAAFAILVERHRGVLLGLCRRSLGGGGLVDDAAQEAILQALLSLDRLRQPERFGPWLGGIGLNVCRRWLRERRDEPWSWEALVGGGYVAEPADTLSPPDLAEDAELAERVRRAVDGLPRGQRAAIARFYLEGLTLAETAAQLGVEVGAVKQRLHQGRAKLRDELADVVEEWRMSDQTAPSWIDVRVVDVRRVPIATRDAPLHAVILETGDGARQLPIYLGRAEADAMALHLAGAQLPRPMTYAFAARLLDATGGRLVESRVSRLVGDVFYAEAVAARGKTARTVDCRPSDAINLALVLDAPIRVESSVFAARSASTTPTSDPFAAGSVGAAEIAGGASGPPPER